MTDHLDGLVARSANFGYLMEHEPLLAYDGASAESYVYTDPASALFKSRHFIEVMTRKLAERVGLTLPERASLDQRINELASASILDATVRTTLHFVRREGNEGVHGRLRDAERALRVVHSCFDLGLWLHNVLTRRTEVRAFVPPDTHDLPKPRTADDGEALDLIRDRVELLERRLAEQFGEAGPDQGVTWHADDQRVSAAEIRKQEIAIERRWDELYADFPRRLVRDRKTGEMDDLREGIIGAGQAWAEESARLERIATGIAMGKPTGGYGATSVVNVAGAGSTNLVIGAIGGNGNIVGNTYGGSASRPRGDGGPR